MTKKLREIEHMQTTPKYPQANYHKETRRPKGKNVWKKIDTKNNKRKDKENKKTQNKIESLKNKQNIRGKKVYVKENIDKW